MLKIKGWIYALSAVKKMQWKEENGVYLLFKILKKVYFIFYFLWFLVCQQIHLLSGCGYKNIKGTEITTSFSGKLWKQADKVKQPRL